MTEFVTQTLNEGVLHLRLNRPTKKNALNHDMYEALIQGLEEAAHDETQKVVLMSGEGADFCAGNDIADFIRFATHEGPTGDMSAFRFLKALTFCPKPIIMAVQGRAVGVGTTMLLHADTVMVADDVKMTLPFLNLGLTPEGGSSLLLPLRIGYARAFTWLTLGEAVLAQEAFNMGLCNKVLTSDTLLETAKAHALKLAKAAPEALRATKAMLRDPEAIWSQIKAEGDIFRARLKSPEATEAFAKFMKS
jgi:enoyl-CoA hydratase/carnithine racemase